MTLDVRRLRHQMNELAVETWHKIETGDRVGLKFSETSITDHNLWILDRSHPTLTVHKLNQNQEALVGADWEWWIGSTREGWIRLAIQAKRVHGRSYSQLGHPGNADDNYQYDLLIDSCDLRYGEYPLHIFYNGWPIGRFREGDGWAHPAEWRACPRSFQPPKCRHAHWVHYGCAAASTLQVKAIHDTAGRNGRLVTKHLSHAFPWSYIFGAPVLSRSPSPSFEYVQNPLDEIQETLDDLVLRRCPEGIAASFAVADALEIEPRNRRMAKLPGYVEAIRQRRFTELNEQLSPLLPNTSRVVVLDLGDDTKGQEKEANSNMSEYERWMDRQIARSQVTALPS
ncbi:DUF6615 family protein [Verrucosispora sp. WMMD573]|uniref:DUF6615 family protein n=1 Tax=Verrucosispora sp. WMMD573 TaxID=3015149 RepID=UPI00248CB9B9|nr:DUF6615 family protein [Verrucosispora sp. WMMD573]WBB53892.1 hypothetical protein O7601_25570 [Verrucosispora sp. WMMD573]